MQYIDSPSEKIRSPSINSPFKSGCNSLILVLMDVVLTLTVHWKFCLLIIFTPRSSSIPELVIDPTFIGIEVYPKLPATGLLYNMSRSEERRVGKEDEAQQCP